MGQGGDGICSFPSLNETHRGKIMNRFVFFIFAIFFMNAMAPEIVSSQEIAKRSIRKIGDRQKEKIFAPFQRENPKYPANNWANNDFGLGRNRHFQQRETAISIQQERFPLYFIGGKSVQPFGVFNNYLISDPITKECYEIFDVGSTLGYRDEDYGLNISFTTYRGSTLMNRLDGFYNSMDQSIYSVNSNGLSFIGNISLSPSYGLSFAIYYDSEFGDSERNHTGGMTLHYTFGKLILDAEYIGAIQREEKYFTNRQEHKESAWFGTLAYQIREPLQVAIRYETFDDDIIGFQDGTLEKRLSLGGKVTIFEKSGFFTNLMAEYRKSSFEQADDDSIKDNIGEFFTRLAIEF